MILIDSNVLIASVVESHVHHQHSARCVIDLDPASILIAAHSLAEVYATLSRTSGPFRFATAAAFAAVERYAKRFSIAALTAPQTFDAIRRFRPLGNGPRLYDFLIGATGEHFGATIILTWNVMDFAPLFPALRVVTPETLPTAPADGSPPPAR